MSYKLQKPYTAKQKSDFIVEYNHNQGLRIEKDDEALYALAVNEVLQNSEIVLDGDYDEQNFAKIKQLKQQENLQKANEAEENGAVEYKDALFETNSSNISKLTAQFAMISAGLVENVNWLSKDDKQVLLNAQDILTLGQLMAEYTDNIWNIKYLSYKTEIENTSTIEEVESIEIVY